MKVDVKDYVWGNNYSYRKECVDYLNSLSLKDYYFSIERRLSDRGHINIFYKHCPIQYSISRKTSFFFKFLILKSKIGLEYENW